MGPSRPQALNERYDNTDTSTEMGYCMPTAKDLLHDLDEALAGAKARFDHADAPHEPDVLALIRAAEALAGALDLEVDQSPVVIVMPWQDWRQVVTNMEKMCGADAEDIEILQSVREL